MKAESETIYGVVGDQQKWAEAGGGGSVGEMSEK